MKKFCYSFSQIQKCLISNLRSQLFFLIFLFLLSYNSLNATDPIKIKSGCSLPCVICPPEWVYVPCGQLDPNLNYGSPTITSNSCGVMISGPYIDGNVQGCGSGQITKTWTVWTYQGDYTCVQHIMVTGGGNNYTNINWPKDLIIQGQGCVAGYEPDQLAPPYNRPTWVAQDCANLMYTWVDEIFYPSGAEGGICKKIFRRWKVVDWCCYDLNNPYSSCVWTHTQIIKIMDNQPPEISCPANITVDAGPNCTGSYVNLPPATAWDNCGNVTITNDSPYDTYGNANASGYYPPGVTKVTFKATDICGNVDYCYTHITVKDVKKPTPVVFHGLATNLMCMTGGAMIEIDAKWFDNRSFDNCTPNSKLKFSVQPSIFTCDDRGYNDIWITVTDEAGNYETVKTYVIISENFGCCGTDTINDPILECPEDVTVNTYSDNCLSQEVAIDVPNITVDCNGSYSLTHDSPYSTSSDPSNASGMYPVGTTVVTYTAVDFCGNVGKCYFKVTVQDGKKPSPVVAKGLEINLIEGSEPGEGQITLLPEWFDVGSFDNCTDNENLVLSISPNYFDCDSIGRRELIFTATDESGNTETVPTFVIITDGNGVCENNFSANISGELITEDGIKISSVDVNAVNTDFPVFKNVDGDYILDSLAGNASYEIVPSKQNEVLNGISTKDLIILKNHVLGKQFINSPYKLLAADIDGNRVINTHDLIALRQIVLGAVDTFPNGLSWRFISRDFSFDPFLPALEQNFIEKKVISKLAGNMENVSFIGVKMGDLNSSVTLFSGSNIQNREVNEKIITAISSKLANDQIKYDLKFFEKIKLEGLQLEVKFNPNDLKWVGSSSYLLPKYQDLIHINANEAKNGIIKISYVAESSKVIEINDILLSLNFAQLNFKVDPEITLTNDRMAQELYLAGDQTFSLKMHNSTLDTKNEAKLYQNIPNPFKQMTTIKIQMPFEMKGKLLIMDAMGQIIKEINQNFNKGMNEVTVNLSVSPGMYYYKLQADNFSETKKMLIVE